MTKTAPSSKPAPMAGIVWRAFRIYFRALYFSLRTIVAGRLVDGIKLFIAPVGYWRFLPNALVFDEVRPGLRVLDVSSPKLLSLYLARSVDAICVSDLDDEKIFTRWGPLAGLLGLHNYTVEYQDARHLKYPDESFDLVYSISVIEHIPDNGDTEALAEFQRVLKPDGIAVVEVPYRRKAQEIYARYDSKGAPLAAPRFYERHYDGESVARRLENIPGLRVKKKMVLGEWLPIDPWIATPRLPRLVRLAILPFEPMLAALNMWVRADDSKGRPLSAFLVYRKE